MKKYIVGLLAMVIAISLSAFTGEKKVNPNNSGKVFIDYPLWYHTTDGGAKVGDEAYDGPAIPKTSVPTECDDVDSPVCLVGSDEPLTFGTTIPADNGSNRILED